MIQGINDRRRLTRRAALAGSALALGAAAVVAIRPAAAQQKLAQSDAQYQATPHGDQHCALCANFQAPNGCKFVQGNIAATGWCQLFAPKA